MASEKSKYERNVAAIDAHLGADEDIGRYRQQRRERQALAELVGGLGAAEPPERK